MGIDVLVAIISGLLSLSVGGLASTRPFERLIGELFRKIKKGPKSYSERLAELTGSLTKASSEVDAVLNELAAVSRDRERAVAALENELAQLESKEHQLQKRIQDLQNIPLPVAEHFAALTAAGEKRSARRDYMLFGAGVLVSTVISILLRVFGFA